MKNKRRRTIVSFRPGLKDLGQRLDDEEFAQEFIEPICASLSKERTPNHHCHKDHIDHLETKE